MAIEEQQAELSWEDAVGRFLEDNPDYFDRNPQLLRQLEVPHPETGRAISLIERQVAALREDNLVLEGQLRQLIDNATENDALSGQLHRFTLQLMQAVSLDQVLETVQDFLESTLNLNHSFVRLEVASSEPADRLDVASGANKVIKQLADRVRQGGALCGIRLTDEESAELFFGSYDGSIALVPIRDSRFLGTLILASDDPKRFANGMATTYLNRIGELIAASVERFL
jgi:uncharacterized protein YigA (DUF484 family)